MALLRLAEGNDKKTWNIKRDQIERKRWEEDGLGRGLASEKGNWKYLEREREINGVKEREGKKETEYKRERE